MSLAARPFPADAVAVTGLGVICAAGANLHEALAAFERGTFAVSAPPFASEHSFPVFLSPAPVLGPLAAGGQDELFRTRTSALAMHAALEALASAGFAPEDLVARPGREPRAPRLGLCVGTSVGASLNFLKFHREFSTGGDPEPDEVEIYFKSNPALLLGGFFGCAGPAQCVTNACSSGADAIGLGAAWIRAGLCDLVLAGGTDELSPVSYAGFSSLRLPSPEACRPFDAGRSGLSLGEGAGFMLLESEASRRKRGRAALSFVRGYGTATDAHHLTAPHPESRGLLAATLQAFAQGGADFADIAFINAHGTATKANDAAEAWFFREYFPRTPFIATKGGTGHTLGASGAIEAVFASAHLNLGSLPKSPGFSETDPELMVAPTSRATSFSSDLALSQSLAFGGNNSVLLLQRGEL